MWRKKQRKVKTKSRQNRRRKSRLRKRVKPMRTKRRKKPPRKGEPSTVRPVFVVTALPSSDVAV